MKLIENIDKIKEPFHNAVVTIGNFDGVHKGHQALFHEVIKKARELNGTSIAMTFEPHPVKVLNHGNHFPLITKYEQKIELIAQSGIDLLICIPFSREFAHVTAEEFIEALMIKQIGMKVIVVGHDYKFGKNREGNIELLEKFSKQFDFEIITCDWIQMPDTGTDRVSSTTIREIVMAGRVKDASKQLGRHYQIRGKVVHGSNRGEKLVGFPTANIELYDELCPKNGIYLVSVKSQSGEYNGVANIGCSPTFTDNQLKVEVHILDFNEELYGQTIRVDFIERLRDEKKFSNIADLSEQIKKDIKKARQILSNKKSPLK